MSLTLIRTLNFAGGLMVGLMLGIAVFWLWDKDIRLTQWLTWEADRDQFDTVIVRKSEPIVPLKEKMAEVQTASKTEIPSVETIDSIGVSGRISSDSLLKAEPRFDQMVVLRDEWLQTKFIEIYKLDPPKIATRADSLIENFDGSQPLNNLMVEYWKSPVNFKGYRWIRNRMVLFGIDPKQSVRIFLLKGQHYLKTEQAVYRIQNAEQFEVFQKVNDENIIKSLP